MKAQPIDGLIVWDYVCGTLGRPCPKLATGNERITEVGPFKLPPPCIYLFPSSVPHPRTNQAPAPQSLANVRFLKALHECFKGEDNELHSVYFEVAYEGRDIVRKTSIRRGTEVQKESRMTPIRRS
jgi:hypothetical protein